MRYETKIYGGDIFNYIDIGEDDRPGHFNAKSNNIEFHTESVLIGMVSGNNGLLVLHPDILVTPSRISEALSCPRKGILSERIRSYDGVGLAGTMGTVKHAFIEVNFNQHYNALVMGF